MRILPLIAFLLPLFLKAQTPIWTDAYKLNNNGSLSTTDFEMDDSGNTYFTGNFSGSVTFGSTKLTATGQDPYVVKADSDGDIEWAINMGGTGFDQAAKMAVDDSQNVYITGAFFNSFIAGNDTFTAVGSYDAFLVKINSQGTVQWTKIATGTSLQMGKTVEVDASGNVYWAGDYFGASTIAGRSISAAGNSYDVWFAKLTGDGNVIRALGYGGNSTDQVVDIAISGKLVYLTGNFFSSDFEIGSTSVSTSGGNDIFLARMDTAFKLSWLIKGGGSSNDLPFAIDASSDGSVSLTGNYITSFAMGGSSISGSWYDAFVVRIAANSKATLLQNIKGNSSFSQDVLPYGVKGFKDGSVMVGGSFQNSLSIGSKSWTPSGGYDVFVAMFNKNGALGWLNQGGNSRSENIFGLEVDSAGYYYVGGIFNTSSKFGSINLSGNGSAMNFVAQGTEPVTPPKYNGLRNRYIYVDSTFSKDYLVKPQTDAKYSLLQGPTGLTFGEDDALLSFTPTKSQVGKHWVVIQAENIGGTAKDSFLIYVIIPVKAEFNTPRNSCFGDELVFDNGNDSVGPVIMTWDFGDGTSRTTDRAFNKTYAAPGKYFVKMWVSNFYKVVDSLFDTISVNNLPIAKIKEISACKNDSIRMDDNTSIVQGSISNFSWYKDGVPFGSSQKLRFLDPSLDTAIISLVVVSDGGCTDSTSTQIVTTGIPKANFSTFNACAGDDALFFDNSTAVNDTIAEYSWSFGDGTSKTVTYPGVTHRYLKGGTFKPELSVKTKNGCVSSFTTSLTVYNKPSNFFEVDDFCFGNSLELEDESISNGGTIVQRRWTTGDGKSYVKENVTHSYKSPGKYTISLITANSRGCTDTLSQEITVAAKAKAEFGYNDVCYGGKLYLQDSSTNGSNDIRSATTWFQDGSLLGEGNFLIANVNTATTSIKLVVKTEAGCSDSIEKSVQPLAPIEATFSLPDACMGDTVAITESFNRDILKEVRWFGFGVEVFKKDSSWLAVYTAADEHKLFGRTFATNGCEDSMLYKDFEAFEIPTPEFSFELDSQNRSYSFVADYKDATTYEWNFGNGQEPSVTTLDSIANEYPNNGTYTVSLKLTTDNGCTALADTSLTINLFSSINELSETLAIYPNPAHNWLKLSLPLSSQANWEVYDQYGKLIMNGTGSELNISEVAQGTYIVKVYTENGLMVGRFLKQ